MVQRPAELFTDIADAIREKNPAAPASIPVQNMATQIQALPTPPPTGFSNNRRVHRFDDFLLPEIAEAANMTLLNGRPLREGVDDQELFDEFKTDRINQFAELAQGPYFTPARGLALNRYLCVGSATGTTTSILKIDTLTNEAVEITGFAARAYNNLLPVGRKVYCIFQPTSSSSGSNERTALCIDVIDNTWEMITFVGSNFSATHMSLVPNTGLSDDGTNAAPDVAWRILFGNPAGGNIYNWFPMLELDADGRAIRSRTWWSGTQAETHHFHVEGWKVFQLLRGNIVYLNTATYGTHRAPVASGGFWPKNWQSDGGRYLYNGGTGQINRVDMETPRVWRPDWNGWEYPLNIVQMTGLPSREYRGFVIDNARDKLFAGTSASGGDAILRVRLSVPTQWMDIAVPGAAGRNQENLLRVGDKIYVLSSQYTSHGTWPTAYSDMAVVDMVNDSAIDLALPGGAKTYNGFFLNGTTLYVLALSWLNFWTSGGSAATGIAIINTLNDQVSEITGLGPSRVLGPIVGPFNGRLYVGSGAVGNTVSVINAANNTVFENITLPSDMPNRAFGAMMPSGNVTDDGYYTWHAGGIYLVDGIIYMIGSGRPTALAQSVLPGSPTPRLPVYIRFGG